MSDIEDITQLVLLERQGRDRAWWPQEAKTFWPDATVRLSWFDGSAADFIKGSKVQRGAVVQGGHMMCPPIVHLQADRALAEGAGDHPDAHERQRRRGGSEHGPSLVLKFPYVSRSRLPSMSDKDMSRFNNGLRKSTVRP